MFSSRSIGGHEDDFIFEIQGDFAGNLFIGIIGLPGGEVDHIFIPQAVRNKSTGAGIGAAGQSAQMNRLAILPILFIFQANRFAEPAVNTGNNLLFAGLAQVISMVGKAVVSNALMTIGAKL